MRACRAEKIKSHGTHRNWEMTVAMAAPRTPILNTKIKSGSSKMFATAPMRIVIIPVRANPCEVTKGLSPSVSSTNGVPTK